MAGERPSFVDPGGSAGRRKPVSKADLVEAHVRYLLDTRGPVPTLAEFGRVYEIYPGTVGRIIKRRGLQTSLQELRTERAELFPRTPETAWFLGMLTGSSGSVRDRSLKFISDSTHKLEAFRRTGESIIGEQNPDVQGIVGIVSTDTQESVRFHSAAHVHAIGDFQRHEKPDTIRKRFGWVLLDPYIDSFASGVFDSGGYVKLGKARRQIDFYTGIQEVADFYKLMLLRLGIANARELKGRIPGQDIVGVTVASIPDLRTFAARVTSVDPQTQQQLDSLKDLEQKERRYVIPESAADLLADWEVATEILGPNPLYSEIVDLREREILRFTPETFTKYLGATAGGKHTFPAARERATALLELDPPERDRELANITIQPLTRFTTQYTDADLLAEWTRIQPYFEGRTPTTGTLRRLFKEGLTTIEFKHYIRRFGIDPDGGPPSWNIATRTLSEITAPSEKEKDIYP